MAANNIARIEEEMVFKLGSSRSPSDVKLRSLEWAIVTQLNGEKTVSQIAGTLALSTEEAREMFARLLAEGLLEEVREEVVDTHVPQAVLDDLEYQFTYHVGPVAAIIIEDTLAEFKRTRANFELRHLPLLVELLSQEISNPEKRYEFEKSMLSKIRGMV